MDPLSVIASSLAIISAVQGTVQAARTLYEAPEQVDSLLNDLTECEILVRTVGTTLQDKVAHARMPQMERERLSSKLERATSVLEELRILISAQLSGSGPLTKVKRSSWVLAKRKALKLKHKLEAVCIALREALGEYKSSRIELELQHVSLLVSDLKSAHAESTQQGKDIAQSMNKMLEKQQVDKIQVISNQEEHVFWAQAAFNVSAKAYKTIEKIERVLLTENLQSSPSKPRIVLEEEQQQANSDGEPNSPKVFPERIYAAHMRAGRVTSKALTTSYTKARIAIARTSLDIDPAQRLALERICDEETLETFEFTDLHRSVVKLSPQTIQQELRALIRSSASIDDTDAGGRTALSWAAQRGDFDAVKLLLEHGADPNNSPPDCKTPLIYAAGLTPVAACASLLLQFSASESAHDPAGLTPLMWGCLNSMDNYSNLKLLLNSSDLELVDRNSRTALFHAASANPVPTQMLILSGCNINHTDNEGYTAFLISIAYSRSRTLKVLLEAGADYTLKTRSGQGTLHQAARFADVSTLQVLIDGRMVGLDTKNCDENGCIPLDLLQSRVPTPSSEIIDKFHDLLNEIESHSGTMIRSRATSSTEGTLEWDTASEGNSVSSGSDEA
ncbi:MAG: hypothetical protein M1821_002994 [Bathelium mastoideum]|nr:MAG: hypothetical protein M1821_002994 [Bathelium mastoideum]